MQLTTSTGTAAVLHELLQRMATEGQLTITLNWRPDQSHQVPVAPIAPEPPPAEPKEWYSTEEFADLVNLKPWTIRDRCNRGKMPEARKLTKEEAGRNGGWVIHREAFDRYQREGLIPARRRKAG